MMESPSTITVRDGVAMDTNTRGWFGDLVFGMLARLAGWFILLVMAGIIIVLVSGVAGIFRLWPRLHHQHGMEPDFRSLWCRDLHFRHAGHDADRACLCRALCIWRGLLAGGNGSPALARFIETAVQLLAAVPSIIFGMWGFFIVVPFMAHYIEPVATHYLGHVPGMGLLFRGAPYGTGLLTGGLILAIMITPFICSVMTDVFVSIPAVLKESAFGLGATRWEVMRDVVLPWSRQAVMGVSCWARAVRWGRRWP